MKITAWGDDKESEEVNIQGVKLDDEPWVRNRVKC